MSMPLVKGYYLRHAVDFAAGNYEPALYAQMAGRLPADLSLALPVLRPTEFCPSEHLSQLLSAMAALADGAAESDLSRCGEFVHERIENQFTRLVMGLLTPATFLHKAPAFWRRDQRDGGRCEVDEVDAGQRCARLRLVGIERYAHIGPLWLGFLRAGLSKLGARPELTLRGYTPEEPGPDEVVYDVRWA